ncbi:hypothetical protein HON71_01695 [Candidatus Woesearchaeota archaeon]|jgi:hypothetical protein|nr:hypothetical protein [Candidatus Woesearchaeota archaeon]MBT5342513.1 hypothetical protein [Candidatus Woesearchaeota archaeon]
MAITNKRGQAAGAAVLLVIIAGLLIGFVILLPPSERAELLDEDYGAVDSTTTDDTDLDDAVIEKNLLTVSPGRVDFLGHKEIEHPLPVVNIYTKTESKIIAEKNIVYAKKGAFSGEPSKFKFVVPDLENSDNLLLSFKVNEVKGEVVITLNGEELFKSEVQDGDSFIVNIPANLVKEENEMLFSASSIGVAFWATNMIDLESVQVVADVTSVEAQSSKNIFLVSETEKKNLEKVILKFKPDCQFTEVGKLQVLINGNEVYFAVPDCELSLVPIEFSPELVYQGENEIVFRTNKGTYVLSHVLIESKLKEVEYPTYYFELSYEQYQNVINDELRLRLEMDFVDVVTSKFGELVFNGHVKGFDTKEVSFAMDLSDDLVQGNNALKVKPKKTLDVREIKIDLVK